MAFFEDTLNLVKLWMGKWGYVQERFQEIDFDWILNNGRCIACRSMKVSEQGQRFPPLVGAFKFNVEGTIRGKP